MAMLRAVAGEKDAGRKLKYFVRGDLGVSYTQFSSLKKSGARILFPFESVIRSTRPRS